MPPCSNIIGLQPFQDHHGSPIEKTASAGPNTFQDHLTITAPHLKTINNSHFPFSKMVTNTIQSIQDIKQRCCSHYNKVHASTSCRNTRKNKAPQHRSDRQSPTNLNSPRHHCQDVHNTDSITSGQVMLQR